MTRATRSATLALVISSLVVSLLIAEGALRIAARFAIAGADRLAKIDPMKVLIEPHGAFGYRQRPNVVFAYGNGSTASANAMGYRGPLVTIPKPAGTFRVILLGESTTHGWGVVDSETIDTYLRPLLAQQARGRRVEVVNLAFDGYDAYQVWQRLLSNGTRFQPDAIIANVGINDVRNARFAPPLGDPDPRTLIWEADLKRLRREAANGGPSFSTRFKHYFFLARLPGMMNDLMFRHRPALKPEVTVYPQAADNFQRNVLRIADVARDLDVPLILSTPPSILPRTGDSRLAPRDYWIRDAVTTQLYRDTLAARLIAIQQQRAAQGQTIIYVSHTIP
ncbi:MAG TPA: SGNH/GDSL hydrolase family protein, partial [Gemmatimonadales bacterium]